MKDKGLLQAKEERCSQCGSIKIERTGGSNKLMGMDNNIGFVCENGHQFHISEHLLKNTKAK